MMEGNTYQLATQFNDEDIEEWAIQQFDKDGYQLDYADSCSFEQANTETEAMAIFIDKAKSIGMDITESEISN